jgi:hypothetical protein
MLCRLCGEALSTLPSRNNLENYAEKKDQIHSLCWCVRWFGTRLSSKSRANILAQHKKWKNFNSRLRLESKMNLAKETLASQEKSTRCKMITTSIEFIQTSSFRITGPQGNKFIYRFIDDF